MFPQRHLRRKRKQGYFAFPRFALKSTMCACKTLTEAKRTVLCDSIPQVEPLWRLGFMAQPGSKRNLGS